MQCAILLNTVIEWNVTSSSPMEENWESSEEKKTPRCQKHLSRCKYLLILFSLTCRTSCSVVWAISIGFHLSFAFFFGFIFYSFNGIVYFVIFLFHHSFYLLFIFFNIFVALDECTVCGARLTCEKHHVFFSSTQFIYCDYWTEVLTCARAHTFVIRQYFGGTWPTIWYK